VTSQRDLDRTLDAFFSTGADEVADRVIDAALLTIEHTQQRRAWRAPWRFPDMSSTWKLATIAFALLLAVGGAAWVIGRVAGPSVGSVSPPPASASSSALPSPSPSASVAPSPTPPSTAGWLQFSSSHYKYKIAYPPTWAATQATRNWDFAKDRLALGATAPGGAVDVFVGGPNANQTAVFGFATDVPAGTSEDAWLASYYAGSGFCPTMPTFVPITVDGQPGRLDPCYDAQAFVFVGTRVYVFVIFRTEQQPLFRAFLSTVRFPGGVPTGSPAPSAGPS